MVESTSPSGAITGRSTATCAAARGFLDLKESEVGTNAGTRKRWGARLRHGGLYVSIESWSRVAVLEAARQLTPIPVRPSGYDPDVVRVQPFPSGGIGEP